MYAQFMREVRAVLNEAGRGRSLELSAIVASTEAENLYYGMDLREWVRPLRGAVCGYLDDLYVDPSVRGSGAVEALYAEMTRIARERGWAIIRWTTADDNYRARSVYDKVATRTTWITYDMTP